ncbi:MAG TPA: hypothetical protein VNR00_05825, partial [Opitutus sp.]|nr:hypothetical protein [Opitutus sp.]
MSLSPAPAQVSEPVIARAPFKSRADSPPRKIVVASAVAAFGGPLERRLALATELTERAAARAAALPGGRGLDLVVLPEFAIEREGT